MIYQDRLAMVLSEFEQPDQAMTDADVNACIEGALVESAKVEQVLREYGSRVMTRHAQCPEDCMMTGEQFSAELLLAGMTIEAENARQIEAQFRDASKPRHERLRLIGQWSVWIVLGNAISEPKPAIIERGGKISHLVKMLALLGREWPKICGEVYGQLLTVEVPDDASGLDS